MSKATVTITNYKKYNDRHEIKKPSWFRMEHGLAFDPTWQDMDGNEMWVWVYLLSFANFKRQPSFLLDELSISKNARVPLSKVTTAIEKLTEKQCITITHPSTGTDAGESFPSTGKIFPLRDEGGRRDEGGETGETQTEFGLNPRKLFDFWNEQRGNLPEAKSLSDDRVKAAKKQIAKYPTLEHWEQVMEKFKASEFCQNQWKPGFDDFLSESKRTKALEGTYDKKLFGGKQNWADQRGAHNLSQMERIQKGEL